MREVEFWCWRVISETTGEPYNTRHKMDMTTAIDRHPEATRVLGSMEIRRIPETDEERATQGLDSGQRHH